MVGDLYDRLTLFFQDGTRMSIVVLHRWCAWWRTVLFACLLAEVSFLLFSLLVFEVGGDVRKQSWPGLEYILHLFTTVHVWSYSLLLDCHEKSNHHCIFLPVLSSFWWTSAVTGKIFVNRPNNTHRSLKTHKNPPFPCHVRQANVQLNTSTWRPGQNKRYSMVPFGLRRCCCVEDPK